MSEHRAGARRSVRNSLQNIPMLDDLPIWVKTEDVDAGHATPLPGGAHSDHLKRSMRSSRQLYLDRYSRAQLAARADNSHDPRLSHDLTVCTSTDDRGEEPGAKLVQLHARIPQPGELDDHLGPETKSRANREAEEVDSACGHVLAEIARSDREPGRTQLVVQLGVDEVDLAQIRLRRIPRHARAMPDRGALMRVSVDAQPRDEPDTCLRGLAEGVAGAPGHGDDQRGQMNPPG